MYRRSEIHSMPWSRHAAWLLPSVALLVAMAISGLGNAAAPPPPAKGCRPSIVVQSQAWVLLPSGPFHDTIIFTRKGDGFGFDGMSYDREGAKLYSGTVGAEAVARLVDALKAPLQPSFRFSSLGAVGSEALRQVQASIRDGTRDRYYTQGQKALLHSIVGDQGKIEAAISRSQPMTHTDDYPRVSVSARLEDCTTIGAKSVSQHLYMLPWVIKGRGETFDPAIANALRGILPEGFGPRDRLGDTELVDSRSLDEMFYSGMSAQLRAAGAEDQAGEVLKALRVGFIVEDAGMAGSLRDKTFASDAPKDLMVRLRLRGSPPNLGMQFRVTVRDGRAPGLDAEMARARALLERVARSPVLAMQFAVDADARFTVNYWYGTSLHPDGQVLDDDEMASFSRYMSKMKGVVPSRQQLDNTALVEEDGTPPRQWVLMPDGRTLLWREVSSRDLSTRLASCALGDADTMSAMYYCIGRSFAPDGKPVP